MAAGEALPIGNEEPHPRTAEDEETLFLVTVYGRRKGSVGMTIDHFANT